MLTSSQCRLKRAGRWLLVALLPFAAHAQFEYNPGNAMNVPGTYTDLGTAGTAIATANTDNDNSAPQPIGFTFTYNGTAFTQFVLSTNGFIRLGATAPSATNLFICNVQGCTNVDPVSDTSPANTNLILPFNFDLEAGTGTPEYRVATTGTAPGRICTIQWKNVSDKSDATPANKQYTNFSFQVKLYETTNNIDFVYGTATPSSATAVSRFPNVGLKGNSNAPGQDVLASKTTGAVAWTATAFITGPYPSSTHNFRNVAPPDAGRTYHFVPGPVPPPPPATYAALPYIEGFEGPWVNDRGTSDVPTLNWHNTPITGDNSWRREDDGFASANWQYQANEVPTANFPTPPYVTRFSAGAHSARFHTFGSAAGTQGKLDLYVNLSGAGTKTLTFDYINPTGTDKVEVLLSTNGGTTFGTSPLLTATTATAFTNKSVAVPSTSATSVIRFKATSDFGDDDIGIDNLRLTVVTATRNEALAAAVLVAPNPARQRFTLRVPAGPLRTASATLANALGQVVATRQLSLPAAGGSTDFDVSRLVPGIYTLTLQAGDDFVVKRVVVE